MVKHLVPQQLSIDDTSRPDLDDLVATRRVEPGRLGVKYRVRNSLSKRSSSASACPRVLTLTSSRKRLWHWFLRTQSSMTLRPRLPSAGLASAASTGGLGPTQPDDDEAVLVHGAVGHLPVVRGRMAGRTPVPPKRESLSWPCAN